MSETTPGPSPEEPTPHIHAVLANQTLGDVMDHITAENDITRTLSIYWWDTQGDPKRIALLDELLTRSIGHLIAQETLLREFVATHIDNTPDAALVAQSNQERTTFHRTLLRRLKHRGWEPMTDEDDNDLDVLVDTLLPCENRQEAHIHSFLEDHLGEGRII